MNKEIIKQFLRENRGYQKYAYHKTASKLGVSTFQVREALREIVSEQRNSKRMEFTLPDSKYKAYIDRTEYEAFLKFKKGFELKDVDFTEFKSKRLPTPYTKGDKKNVLIIGDTHFPFEKEGYLEFCREQQERFNCGTVVHIGDEVDLCAISQWERDPDGLSAGSESERAQSTLQDWFKVFPEVKVAIGNHTARPFRMARTAGIPKKFIKTYADAWNAPKGWQWSEQWEIDGILYTHGTGLSGAGGAIKLASQYRQNVVIGHIHSEAGIQYNASKKDIIWGMQVGSGVDDSQYAFAYARDQIKKSIISCGIVLEGKQPLLIPMSI